MMLSDTNVQDWDLADRNILKTAIEGALTTSYEHDDIWVVGSRIMGFHKPGSDMDVIVWFDEYERAVNEKSLHQVMFEGIEMRIAKWETPARNVTTSGYTLPYYSLTNMSLTAATAQQMSDWLDYRVENIPGFLDGRDNGNLVFEYAGENQTILDWLGE